MSVLSDLSKKNIDVESIAKKALKNMNVLSELLDGILSKEDTIRYNSFKILMSISEYNPELLYPRWNHFQDLLRKDNNYQKLIAIRLIANLTRIDTENKFEKIFDEYYKILEGEGTMTAGHLAANSGKIAKAKPNLQSKITSKLLNIDKIHHGKQKELIKGYAIEAFSEYFEEADDKNRIIDFVRKQLDSKSPKTQKKAKEFLKIWEKRVNISNKDL